MRFASSLLRAAFCAALFATLAACGSSSSSSSPSTPTPSPAVSGVQTPSQISVVTAK